MHESSEPSKFLNRNGVRTGSPIQAQISGLQSGGGNSEPGAATEPAGMTALQCPRLISPRRLVSFTVSALKTTCALNPIYRRNDDVRCMFKKRNARIALKKKLIKSFAG
jgi:hypothetical protein